MKILTKNPGNARKKRKNRVNEVNNDIFECIKKNYHNKKPPTCNNWENLRAL